MILVKPEDYVQDTVALDLTSRLAWKTLDVPGAANVMRGLAPTDRAAVAQKMVVNGTEPAVANAVLAMSFTPMKGLGQNDITSIGTRIYTIGTWPALPLLAYHGYKRNNSIGWALVWGIFGSIFWPITLPIALAQGFGEPER